MVLTLMQTHKHLNHHLEQSTKPRTTLLTLTLRRNPHHDLRATQRIPFGHLSPKHHLDLSSMEDIFNPLHIPATNSSHTDILLQRSLAPPFHPSNLTNLQLTARDYPVFNHHKFKHQSLSFGMLPITKILGHQQRRPTPRRAKDDSLKLMRR
jgi:hypothetical protein